MFEFDKKINRVRVVRVDSDTFHISREGDSVIPKEICFHITEASDLHYMLSQILADEARKG